MGEPVLKRSQAAEYLGEAGWVIPSSYFEEVLIRIRSFLEPRQRLSRLLGFRKINICGVWLRLVARLEAASWAIARVSCLLPAEDVVGA